MVESELSKKSNRSVCKQVEQTLNSFNTWNTENIYLIDNSVRATIQLFFRKNLFITYVIKDEARKPYWISVFRRREGMEIESIKRYCQQVSRISLLFSVQKLKLRYTKNPKKYQTNHHWVFLYSAGIGNLHKILLIINFIELVYFSEVLRRETFQLGFFVPLIQWNRQFNFS